MERETSCLKEEVALLKGGQSNLKTSTMDRDPPFIESMIFESLLKQFQQSHIYMHIGDTGPIEHIRAFKD